MLQPIATVNVRERILLFLQDYDDNKSAKCIQLVKFETRLDAHNREIDFRLPEPHMCVMLAVSQYASSECKLRILQY